MSKLQIWGVHPIWRAPPRATCSRLICALHFRSASPITVAVLAKVCSAAVSGIEAYPVEVEVNAGYGDTLLIIVGLPDAAVKESRDRVMTALINSGFSFTFGRTTINLAPASV